MTIDKNINDLVLLPNGFKTLLIPEPLISFFQEFNVDYKSADSFPMEILRSLYRKDYKNFYRIVYFLSLYGCNFHSARTNSFFPADLKNVEEVISISSSPDDSFSITDMNQYGVRDFCTNASSSKCQLLNGVVIARFQKNSQESLIKLMRNPLISIVKKCIYGHADLKNEENSLLEEQASAPLDEAPLLKNDADSLEPAVILEKAESQESENAPDSDDQSHADFALAFSNTLSVRQDSFDNQKKAISLEFNPISSETGVCAPRFWVRFVSTFFVMDKRVQEVYLNLGYKTFGDLIDFKKEDVNKVAEALNGCLNDPYLIGNNENELICFCKERDSFLEEFEAQRSLAEFLLPSDFTIECIKKRPDLFYYFDKGSFPFYDLPLEEFCQKQAKISDFDARYLKMVGITQLDFIGHELLGHQINDCILPVEMECLSIFLNPINVIDDLCCSLMNEPVTNLFGVDHEIYAFWIQEAIRAYARNLKKYEDKKRERRILEILNLRETTDSTLEELGKNYGITRERVRQIEAKGAKGLFKPAKLLLDTIFENQSFLPLYFIKRFTGLLSYIRSDKTNYYLDEDLGVALRVSDKAVIEKMKIEISGMDSLKDLQYLDAFYQKNGFSFYGWLNEGSHHIKYDPYPEFIIRKTTMDELGKRYLLSKGVLGYDIKKDENELMNFYKTNAPYMKNVTYRGILNDVLRSGAILRGMSTYISPKFVTEEQKKLIKQILDGENFGDYGFTGLSLFERHKRELLRVGIDNGYFLYGIASTYFKEDYQFGGRSLRITRLGSGDDSLANMAEHYVLMHGPIVRVEDFLRDLHLKVPALQQITVLTKYDVNTLVLKSWFKWTKYEFLDLEDFIDKKIKEQGFCHAYDIIYSHLYFDDSKNAFLKINRIGNDPTRLIYFLDAIAERYQITEYHFSHHCECISFSDEPVETKADMVMSHFEGRVFTKKEVETFLKKFHLTGNVSGSDFYDGWTYFIDLDHLALKQDLQMPNETIKDVSDILDEYYGNEIFITSLTALNRIKFVGYHEQFDDEPVEMASILTDSKDSNWAVPENDIRVSFGFFRTILANKKLVGDTPKYSALLRLYVQRNRPGCFLSIQDIQKELKEQELIDNHINLYVLKDIFGVWFNGFVVEVPNKF